MSAPATSANKPGTTFNEENEALYEPYPSYTLSRSCAEPPWPEWSDAELNAESWDEGKLQRASTSTKDGAKNSVIARPVFDDPNPPTFPPALSENIYTWKRPKDVFKGETGNEELMVYNPSNTEFLLNIPSKAFPKYEFFEAFMEQMRILQFFAVRHRFMVELETANYSSTTQGEIWRPWHHVYALCKAGKGQVHKPLYCPYGKYVVRLFYMGVWRKFVVDDKIPCDMEGNCVLPVTQYPGELWSIILIKALLKILSLTPTNHYSTTDFPLLTLFTGWVEGHFLAGNKSSRHLWDRFVYLIPRYEQTSSDVENDDKSVISPSLKNHGKKDSAKKDSRKEFEVFEPKCDRFCFVMATLKMTKSSNFDDTVGITMVRDCPLVRAVRRAKTKPWKKIRWEHWAKEKGLWVDDTTLPPYRRLQIISYNLDLREVLYPDPKLEASLYELPVEDALEIENNIADVPEEWCDFLKLRQYVRFVKVFFKPSCFFGSFKISCLTQRTAESTPGGKGTPGGKRTAKVVPPPQNTFVFPACLKHSGNEPIFLLSESQTGIFLLISLWVCPSKSLPYVGYLRKDQPKFLKVGHGTMIIELHDWRSYEQGVILGVIKTVGNSSIAINLRAGRHVLKMWLCTDSAYVVDVYSNSSVFVSKGPRIRFLMSNETQRIINYINNVSNAFIALTLKFGKPDLPKALRDFYNVIRPGNDYSVGYLRKLDLFIETFLNSVLQLLKELIPNNEDFFSMMGAMRSLFINPDLYCESPKTPTLPFGSAKIPFIITFNLTPAEAYGVVTIQRFFRGYRIRLLWKCQTPGRKEFKLYTERLKKICDTIFVPTKRELEVGKLLRKIVMARPELLTTFKFHEDFANVLQVDEFTGKIANVEPFAWVPITRFVMGCHSEDLVPCFFYLSCNLERFVIQGFNNDTGDEIFRVANSVSTHYYHKNIKGYTILAFGWNEANFKTVNWRLEMVRMKHFQMIHLCNLLMNPTCQPYSIPNLEIFELRNFYVPNSKSRICRCLIKIQKRALLTLRLSLSYTDVQFELRISLRRGASDPGLFTGTENNKVVWRVVSKNGVVIVPSLLLECVDNRWFANDSLENAQTVFSIEAFVLNNSWPLTKQEWGLVEPLRVNGESRNDSTTSLLSRKGRPESKKRMTRTSRKSLSEQKVMDNPLWILQVLNDLTGPETVEPIVIEEDKSHAEAVRAMKALWKEKDPGRRKRGKDMRMRFLYRTLLEERKNKLYGEDEETCEGEEDLEDPQWIFDRLSSFSYLTNDTSPTRYTYSPRILPGMPLMELLCKYRKQPSDSDGGRDARSVDTDTEISFTIVRNMIDEIEEDRKDFSMQCTHYRTVLMNHINEELKLSNRLMEQAYEDRLKALAAFTR